ncbi:MAG TPA: hypothetical protein VFQ80_11930 [Thermomicrobiales bacterium]|jgi:hypothetical protein|nr:hypothetical protein [Thermomicrobiales bacterium]
MAPLPQARSQIGIARDPDRVAVLADTECFALAQAKQIVIAQLLREGAWPFVVVIVRRVGDQVRFHQALLPPGVAAAGRTGQAVAPMCRAAGPAGNSRLAAVPRGPEE